jgi:hypothetical protein
MWNRQMQQPVCSFPWSKAMKLRTIFAVLFITVMFTLLVKQPIASQNTTGDYVFFVSDISGTKIEDVKYHESRNTIMRLDTESLELMPFYTADWYQSEDSGYITVLGWSPNSTYLAILQVSTTTETSAHICLLTTEGTLHICLEDTLDFSNPILAEYDEDLYDVWWSEDEEFIYYLIVENDSLKVAVASTQTGEQQEVLYEFAYDDDWQTSPFDPVFLQVAANLEKVVLFQGFETTPATYGLENNEATHIEIAKIGENERLSYIVTNLQTNVTLFFCRNIAPSTNYLTARLLSDVPKTLLILDLEGNIVDSLETTSDLSYISCPSWSNDGESLAFLAVGLDDLGEISEYKLIYYSVPTSQLIDMELPFNDITTGYWGLDFALSQDGLVAMPFVVQGPYAKLYLANMFSGEISEIKDTIVTGRGYTWKSHIAQ